MKWNEVKFREANISRASSLPAGQAGIQQLKNKLFTDKNNFSHTHSVPFFNNLSFSVFLHPPPGFFFSPIVISRMVTPFSQTNNVHVIRL